ncbi:Dyp-type peroxidase [Leucobacter sp. OH1287]|uniref:Dyp-type peroxidase n=1 Tax=Leucobacter sp. OH1287 TaxID=2491049 RepID=UPI000F5DCD8C|nr:Dyp-type peroxidase [Leucobacter sp. OH1287]RRD61798.1 Dyp-type peroxidase [Leucobacter sp. OH1287]
MSKTDKTTPVNQAPTADGGESGKSSNSGSAVSYDAHAVAAGAEAAGADAAGADAAQNPSDLHSSGSTPPAAERGVSRRGLIGGALAGVGLVGVAAGSGVTAAVLNNRSASPAPGSGSGFGSGQPFGKETISCHGKHQAGVATAVTAHSRYLAFNLSDSTNADAIRRMLTVLTADIESLTSGQGPIADSEPELAENPARLTVTVGFGPELVNRVNPAARPDWLGPLPRFNRDQLGAGYDDGDLLIAIASDDPLTVAHAARMLSKSLRSFASLVWRQDGFRRAHGSEPDGATMRNLMGQVDGTVNPRPNDDDYSDLVWLQKSAGWLAGGSAMVFRRIRMELDTWDQVDKPGRENSIGRDIAVGAPLTGTKEFDEPDFTAKNELGLPIIHAASHIARARSSDPNERIYRRVYNYDDSTDQGLLFICYQRNPLEQFVPIQRRLDQLDLLNTWITHTGSAVFAIPPGWEPGGMLGETLFAS